MISHTNNNNSVQIKEPEPILRGGYTTGCCATAGAVAATLGLVYGHYAPLVTVHLPNGIKPTLAIDHYEKTPTSVTAHVMKDAGDDPDITDGIMIHTTVTKGKKGDGITFSAGEGVGVVTLPGLSLQIGEPAINPAPRLMIERNIDHALATAAANGFCVHPDQRDFNITIAAPSGVIVARETWNPRLGIEGGISILGTTGVVIPYSCSAWIHSIHRGIDIVLAGNKSFIGAATGRTSDTLLQNMGLPSTQIIDMGDFLGSMLLYLNNKKCDATIILAAGVGKATKVYLKMKDLSAKRSPIDYQNFAQSLTFLDQESQDVVANSTSIAMVLSRLPTWRELLLKTIVRGACERVLEVTQQRQEVIMVIVDRSGKVIAGASTKGALATLPQEIAGSLSSLVDEQV